MKNNLWDFDKLGIYTINSIDILNEYVENFNVVTDLVEFKLYTEKCKNKRNKFNEANLVIESRYFDLKQELLQVTDWDWEYYKGKYKRNCISVCTCENNTIINNLKFYDYMEEKGFTGSPFSINSSLSKEKFREYLDIVFSSDIFIDKLKDIINIARSYKICTLFDKNKDLSLQKIVYQEGNKTIVYIAIKYKKLDTIVSETDNKIINKNLFAIICCDVYSDEMISEIASTHRIPIDVSRRRDDIENVIEYYIIQEEIKDFKTDEITYGDIYPVKETKNTKYVIEYNKL